jgi:DNA-binding transcriptional LysR family regulator
MNPLRQLGFDDLLIMKGLGEGLSLTKLSKVLNISQPAVTQRLRKIEDAFELKLVERDGRTLRLTPEGRQLASKSDAALAIFKQAQINTQVVTIGTRPDVSATWIWPSVSRLMKRHAAVTAHVMAGSGDEILQQLGLGRLDAVVTSAPLTIRDFRAIELLVEDYLFVASKSVAKKIKSIEDLSSHVLVEHDRSFPFQRYLTPDVRAKMQFKDVLFCGSTRIMAAAIADGAGVGIIPEFAAQPYLDNKTLQTILPKIKIQQDSFRLIYRQDRGIEDLMVVLAQELKAVGLK